MLEDTIAQLKKAIADSAHLDQAKRDELLRLSEKLHEALEQLDQEQATDIAKQTHDAVTNDVPAESLKESVQKFEVEHPNLTRIISSICAQFGV